ncbi:MAG: SUMF1/EgtB/PvdO family nonheme iron enzyme, partial [Leptolyngbyaceae cyanobacterium CAN_BIN12]|nr:SUMF1/EgtB/PvdO family nonheme iron enzyme [Leptolyngbyaceae cyanobacterium CAN_BIN12]
FTAVLLYGLLIQVSGICATVERLDQHLRIQVPDLNRRYHKPRQTPYTTAEPNAKRHLILLPTFDLADVMVLKNDALEAEADRDWELAEHLWTRVLAVSPADAQAIRAIKRIARMDIENHPRQPDKSLLPVSSRGIVEPQGLQRLQFEVITVDHQGREQRRDRKRAEYLTEDLGNGVTLEIVKIPGGRFLMGTADSDRKKIIQEYVKGGVSQSDAETYVGRETPQHEVTVQSFWMGKYAVTQAQYAAIMGTNPANFKGAQRPVEQVSWDDAIAFCTQLSQKTGKLYRLPSEAEWEYACRAETTTPFHFGETITPDLANYDGNYTYGEAPKGTYREQTSDVGSFPANAFGLSDMHGNVWEWCADQWYGSYANKPESLKQNGAIAWTTENTKVSPKPDEAELRLLRGGSW